MFRRPVGRANIPRTCEDIGASLVWQVRADVGCGCGLWAVDAGVEHRQGCRRADAGSTGLSRPALASPPRCTCCARHLLRLSPAVPVLPNQRPQEIVSYIKGTRQAVEGSGA